MTTRWAALASITVLLTGCASFVAPTYSPDYPSIDRLKASQLGKVSVGVFQPRSAEAPVNRITLRGAAFAPASGTFAEYLENAIRSDLTELRVLDPNAGTRIDATLLKNDIDVSGINTGEGFMDVKLTVSKGGKAVHEKVYSARTQFESSLAAAVAVPKGQSEYPRLVRTLLQTIYADPAFIAAVQP
ncbi:hypothetical protein [Hydrogenophaga sp.]|uniref:hypothetical protein n=1 Tax=Hydrogenophaga sp. TaxID=1904254 RepID=UPI003F6F959F